MPLDPTAPNTEWTDTAMMVERVPQRHGIQWEGLVYNSPAVTSAGNRMVRIAIDPSDLTSIMMHDPGRQEWIPVPLVMPRLQPGQTLSYQQHLSARNLVNARTQDSKQADPDSDTLVTRVAPS